MTRIAPIVALALTASAFTPPTHSRPPTQLAAGFGKATKSKDKAVQIKGAPKPMDKQWDNYFALKDAEGEIREVWLTTPGGDKPLPLGFVAAKKDGSPKEAVALQKKLIMWCAEGLHPRLSPFLRGKMKDGQAKLELNLCKVRELSDEEAKKEEEAGDPLAGGIGPGGPLDPLGPVRAPPSLKAADVGFMPFKSPIDGEQAALRKPSKREMSNGVVR